MSMMLPACSFPSDSLKRYIKLHTNYKLAYMHMRICANIYVYLVSRDAYAKPQSLTLNHVYRNRRDELREQIDSSRLRRFSGLDSQAS